MKPYYEDELVSLYCGDAVELVLGGRLRVEPGVVVVDPPWDDEILVEKSAAIAGATLAPSRLVFTDPRRFGDVVRVFGAPAWVFTWDTMNQWSAGPRRPIMQTKHCAWYGDLDSYRRDATLWGDAPEARDHPSTQQTPLDGRRLTDLWRESLRWLHNPSAGSGSAGTERFSKRQGDAVLRHAKPVGWLRCLIGNCSDGLVFDPFAGSGSALRAAKDLGRPAVGIEISEEACEHIVRSLAQEVLPIGAVA